MGLCNLSAQIGVKHELNTSRKFHVKIIITFHALNWDFFLIIFYLKSINWLLDLLFDDKRLY